MEVHWLYSIGYFSNLVMGKYLFMTKHVKKRDINIEKVMSKVNVDFWKEYILE